MPKKRPYSVTFLAVGVLIFAAFHWMRFAQAIRLSAFLAELPLTVSPQYLLITGLIFGLVSLPIMWGLWVGARWAPIGTQVLVVFAAVLAWFDRLFLTSAGASAGDWVFALGVTFVLLLFFALTFKQPGARVFFSPESADDNTRDHTGTDGNP